MFDESDRFGSRGGMPGGGWGSRSAAPAPVVQMQFDEPDVTVRAAEVDDKIFNVVREQGYVLPPSSRITACAFSDSIYVVGMNSGALNYFNARTGEMISSIADTRGAPSDFVKSLFIDARGEHLLIVIMTGNTPNTYYWHRGWKSAKPLSKVKGILITAVGWNPKNEPDSSMGPILLGTNDGIIYEYSLEPKDKQGRVGKVEEKNLTQLVKLQNLPPMVVDYTIHDIYVEKMSENSVMASTGADESKYLVFVTQESRITQFMGGPTFDAVFGDVGTAHAQDMLAREDAKVRTSKIGLYRGSLASRPDVYAWKPGACMLFYASGKSDDEIGLSTKIKFPLKWEMSETPSDTQVPIGFALTKFHTLLLYENMLQAVCRLNNKVVFERDFASDMVPMLDILQDPVTGRIAIYSRNSIFYVEVRNEGRDMWRIYLEKGEYDKALKHTEKPEYRDKIEIAHAEQLYSSSKLLEAAAKFAYTTFPLEEIVLRFARNNQRDALKHYLVSKYKSIKLYSTSGDPSGADKAQKKTQRVMIAGWLSEIYLSMLTDLSATGGTNSPEYTKLSHEFREFLRENVTKSGEAKARGLEAETYQKLTFQLIGSHGCEDEFVEYAIMVEEFEKVLLHHIQRGEYKEAVRVLSKPEISSDLIYRYSPVLMEHAPRETVDAWLKKDLDPAELIPALVKYKPNGRSIDENPALRFLRQCVVNGNDAPVVHNYLLTLYVEEGNIAALQKFLSDPGLKTYYDPEYALRLCLQHKLYTACVFLYSRLGLYEEAVDMALKFADDIVLATANAKKAEEPDLQKRLWLRIARQVVEKEKDIKKAMEFLKECDDVLKIEDILPFFPPFSQIDDFKDEICDALAGYNVHIDELRKEMDEAQKSANDIRNDIKALKNRYTYVRHKETCVVCTYPLRPNVRDFVVFPCRHTFHPNCLLSLTYEQASTAQKVLMRTHMANIPEPNVRAILAKDGVEVREEKKVEEGDGARAALFGLRIGSSTTSAAAQERRKDSLVSGGDAEHARLELNKLLMDECPLCGSRMVHMISVPFLDPSRDGAEMATWALDD